MKIFTSEQIREVERYSIVNEPISSIAIMERAASAFEKRFRKIYTDFFPVYIFCGKGNNGGDGLAIGRLLRGRGYDVHFIIAEHQSSRTEDTRKNYNRAKGLKIPIQYIEKIDSKLVIPNDAVVIDALLGIGLNREAEGIIKQSVDFINTLPNEVVSVDMPTGLFSDKHTSFDNSVIQANYTITFQLPKLALFIAENTNRIGQVFIEEIGWLQKKIEELETPYFYTKKEDVAPLLKSRKTFTHKGTYGHGLFIGGSYGKMGAAVFAGSAAMRAGLGLLTMHIPGVGYNIVQISLPEAMCTVSGMHNIEEMPTELERYSAIGIGPGLGKSPETAKAFSKLLDNAKGPMVIDADALNIIADDLSLLQKVPKMSILTPHAKEFNRLTAVPQNDFECLKMLELFSAEHEVVVCLKGAFTAISIPNGPIFLNSTGNPGMATAGSGDALTGIILGLLCQGYNPEDAAILGVYLHGLSGDFAADVMGMESVIATDIVNNLGKAFKALK
ncbi:MAG: hydroxyethylthiazole kinase-like uncharacterized protein yjeF [Sphingobacteriales bacterium]|jgi:hydroxyethylthiazole kinase-like uncharacterized protein yjeF